jgi:hypothetical protein
MDNGQDTRNEPGKNIVKDKDDSPLASQFPSWDLVPPVLIARRKP